MTVEASTPRTARDALLTELLSDIGNLHDDVKAIPSLLRLSMSDSLEIIANAVADAEATAQTLQEATKEAIQSTAARVALEAGVELAGAIQQSLERTFEPSLTRASTRIDEMEQRLKSLSGSVRDTHATRINYIILIGFVVAMLLSLGGMFWVAAIAQQNSDTNKWFYGEYKAQRAIIDTLPLEVKKRFVN